MIEDSVFWRNRDREYVVVKYGFSKNHHSLYIMTKSAYTWKEQENGETILVPIANLSNNEIGENEINYQIAEIIYEDNLFVHKRVETGTGMKFRCTNREFPKMRCKTPVYSALQGHKETIKAPIRRLFNVNLLEFSVSLQLFKLLFV